MKMRNLKIVIRIDHSPAQCYYAEVKAKDTQKAIKTLLREGKRSKAIVKAMLNSSTLREINEKEMKDLKADIIIKEDNIYYDLM